MTLHVKRCICHARLINSGAINQNMPFCYSQSRRLVRPFRRGLPDLLRRDLLLHLPPLPRGLQEDGQRGQDEDRARVGHHEAGTGQEEAADDSLRSGRRQRQHQEEEETHKMNVLNCQPLLLMTEIYEISHSPKLSNGPLFMTRRRKEPLSSSSSSFGRSGTAQTYTRVHLYV